MSDTKSLIHELAVNAVCPINRDPITPFEVNMVKTLEEFGLQVQRALNAAGQVSSRTIGASVEGEACPEPVPAAPAQEPVAWRVQGPTGGYTLHLIEPHLREPGWRKEPLYAAPQSPDVHDAPLKAIRSGVLKVAANLVSLHPLDGHRLTRELLDRESVVKLALKLREYVDQSYIQLDEGGKP